MPIAVRRLTLQDLGLVAQIDRSEQVDVEFTVVDGRIVERPVSMTEIPAWDPIGSGPYSVAAQLEFLAPIIERGAAFLGAFGADGVAGLAVIDTNFEPSRAWLAWLYVSRRARRTGVATALWDAAMQIARDGAAEGVYVSAVPTGSAVGFYLSRGCEPAATFPPVLAAAEPDDVHLVCWL